MDLKTKVQFIKGVGPKIAEKLDKLGVKTVQDLLFYFPRAYLDYTKITKIGDLESSDIRTRTLGEDQNQNITIKVKIINIANRSTRRRKFTITEAMVADESSSIKVVWFNQPYLAKMLSASRELILNGKISFDRFSGQLQMESPTRTNYPRIVAVYSETVGISSGFISRLISNSKFLIPNINEYLPEEMIRKNNLMGIQQAILTLHQPDNSASIKKARERMAFDELFLFLLQKQLLKNDIQLQQAPAMKIDQNFLQKFVASLPFELTAAQKKVSWKIIQDLAKNKPMNRLLNGDVGSGKTIVAAFAAAVAVKNGFRVALMAPTEILANQHYKTLSKIFKLHGASVGLVTAAETKKLSAISRQLSADILVGTQALLHLKEPIGDLGLVIIDEQHRFGVSQREALINSKFQGPDPKKITANNYQPTANFRPHYLSMTATPIPRTMSLVVFANLDVSVIDEMPKNRKKIITKVISPAARQKAYDFVEAEAKVGHQTFVICPLIEDKETIKSNLFDEDKKTVVKEAERLQREVFPNLRIAMLHGKLKSQEKEAIMTDFKAKKYDILVSTSMVEVGVDILSATVMMIEDAESFGLAQLHQFRGRVGRSNMQSHCLIFSSSNSENARRRLSYMEKISSGFELAEKDLQLRGPGQMYGYQQSGFWDFSFADIGDRIMIERATEAAKSIASVIDKYSELKKKVGEIRKHLE